MLNAHRRRFIRYFRFDVEIKILFKPFRGISNASRLSFNTPLNIDDVQDNGLYVARINSLTLIVAVSSLFMSTATFTGLRSLSCFDHRLESCGRDIDYAERIEQ